MTGQGTGPSRRSHTKSRKGCKTCKRRHIRCDESFPHCLNCRKHQVRCDYMENIGSDSESQHSPEQQSLCFTPGTESRIDLWQQTGAFPYPGLQVFPPPQTHEYSKAELRLIHHLSTVSNNLMLNGTTKLNTWTAKVPKLLSLASSYPFVMQALLSFSANHLAWEHSSSELRNVHIHHGTIALRGLHEAIGGFSHANCDAVLAASWLLLWQANDWRSWSSLHTGVQSVLAAMESGQHQSIFAEYIEEGNSFRGAIQQHRRSSSLDVSDQPAVLQNCILAIQHLQTSLIGHADESQWIAQLLEYLQRLQASDPAQTPDEQFSHLYILRKWLFWVPTSLLQRPTGQGPATLVLAHFYAVALSLEPLYPGLGAPFCARVALAPLAAIIDATDAMESANSMAAASLMHFPRQTLLSFRTRAAPPQQFDMHQGPNGMSINSDALSYTSIGNLSPAFAPSALHYTPEQVPASSSVFLEVPVSQSSFTLGTSEWGIAPSPSFPPYEYTLQDDQVYGYDDIPPVLGDFHGGFVSSAPIWT